MADDQKVNRPYLQIALFCEKVLREQDGVLSLVRVIDRLFRSGLDREMQPFTHQFFAVVTFKSGFMKGKMRIRLSPKSPTGEQLPELEFPVLFESDDRGAGVVVVLNFTFQQEGLYWFDVYLEDELVTRMPMRVVYQQAGPGLPYAPPA